MPRRDPITTEQIDQVKEALRNHRPHLDDVAVEAQRLLSNRRNVILYGPPGTGKSRAALQLRTRWMAKNGANSAVLATFHPSYAYEDFVEGWRPDPSATGGFDLSDGVLFEAIDLANEDSDRDILLIIDEINRGDVARIFGEFITFIEHDKRGIDFTTAQTRRRSRQVPNNLFLLGTMNTADKSINLLDTALRRRFAFVLCAPDPEVFDSSPELRSEVGGIQLKELLTTINQRLAHQRVEAERQIGHAMLCIPIDSSDPEQQLLDRLCYEILPLVAEYLYGEPERIREVLPGLVDDNGLPKRPDQVTGIGAVLGEAVLAPVVLEEAAEDPEGT